MEGYTDFSAGDLTTTDGSAPQVSPYPVSAGGGATDPATAAYMTMLGFPQSSGQRPAQTAPVAQPNPFAMPTTTPGAVNPAIAQVLPAWMGLGISGQKAQQMPVIPAQPTVYTPPPQPQQKSSGGGGGGGIGGIMGGFL